MITFYRQFSVVATIITMLVMVAGANVFSALAASAPNILTYQGRLLDANGAPVSTSTASMKFFLYTAASGGTCVWSNSSSDCDSNTPGSTTTRTVSLTNGLFSENLGDTSLATPYAAISDSTFADNGTIYLEVIVGGETLSPRRLLTAAPYALNADTLDGIDSATLQLWEVGSNGSYEDDAAAIVGADAAFSSASGGVGDLKVANELEVDGDAYLESTLAVTGNTTLTGDLAVNGGDITSTVTTWNFDVANTGSIRFRDGSNILMTLTDNGTTGNLSTSGDVTSGADLIVTSGARIGTGSNPDSIPTVLQDDSLFVEGLVEIDGATRIDGALTATSTLAVTSTSQFTGAASFDGGANPANAGDESLGTTALEWDGLYLGDDGSGVQFGADQDYLMVFDSGESIFQMGTQAVAGANIDYALYTLAADTTNVGMTANAEIFEIGKGGSNGASGTWTELFSVDEDGDVVIAGTLSGAISASDVTCADCLDFADFEDTLNLDVATEIDNGLTQGNVFSINLSSTGDFYIEDEGTPYFAFNDDRSIDYTSNQTTTDPFDFTADSVTTANGFDLSVDGLTTGRGFYLTSTSGSATTADLAVLSASGQYTVSGTTVSGNLLDVSRSLDMNDGNGGVVSLLSVTSPVVSIADTCFSTGNDVCVNTGNVLSLTQSYASAAGSILAISNAGTGDSINIAGAGTGTAIDIDSTTYGTDIELQNGLTIDNDDDNDLTFDENSLSLNLDFGESEASTITLSTEGAGFIVDASSRHIALTTSDSGDGNTSNIVLASGNTAPDAAADGNDVVIEAEDDFLVETTDDIDFDVGGDFNVTAVARFVLIASAANAPSSLGIVSNDETEDLELTTLGTLGDIVLTSVDTIDLDATNDLNITSSVDIDFANGEALSLDANTTNTTLTTGILNMDVGAGDAAVDGINLTLTQNTASAGVEATGIDLLLDAQDTDGNLIGINITNQAGTTAGVAGNYEALMRLTNTEGVASVVTDALLINDTSGTAGSIVDAIDVSDTEITNAINADANFYDMDGIRFFEGTTGTLTFEDTSGNDLMTLTDASNLGNLTLTGALNAQASASFTEAGSGLAATAPIYSQTSVSTTLTADRNDYGGYFSLSSSGDPNGNTHATMGVFGGAFTTRTVGVGPGAIYGTYGYGSNAGTITASLAVGAFGTASAFTAGGTVTTAVGVQGQITAGAGDVSSGFGGYFVNTADGDRRYGIFAEASGGGTSNHAAFFSGAPVSIEVESTPGNPTSATAAGTLYVEGLIETDGDLYVDGGDITTNAGALTIDPTTYTRIGNAGTPGSASTADDLYVSQDFEVDGTAYMVDIQALSDNTTATGSLFGFAVGVSQSGDLSVVRADMGSNISVSTANGTDYVGFDVLPETFNHQTHGSTVTHSAFRALGTGVQLRSLNDAADAVIQWRGLDVILPATLDVGADAGDSIVVDGARFTAPTSATDNPNVYGVSFASDGAENEWTAEINFEDTDPVIRIATTGTLTIEDSAGNDLMTLTDNADVGDLVLTGDLTVNGDDITSDGALTIDPTTYTRIGNVSTPGNASTDDDLYISGALEVDGRAYFDERIVLDNGGSDAFVNTIDIDVTSNGNGYTAIDTYLIVSDDAESDLVSAMSLFVENNATTADDEVYVLQLGNGQTNAAVDAFISARNYDANTAVTDGIIFVDDGGTITDAIDASDDGITNAINVGANAITGTTATIGFTDFGVNVDGQLDIQPDLDGDAIEIDMGAAANIQAIDIDAATNNSRATNGLIQLTADMEADNSNTTGVNIDYEIVEEASLGNNANTHAALDILATMTSNDGDHLYGLRVQDLAGTAAGGNEYAIYQAGTAWDFGLYVTDDARFDGDVTLSGGALSVTDTTGAEAIFVTADSVTTGNAMTISADGLTQGNGLNITSTSTSINNGALLQVAKSGSSNTQQNSGNYLIDFSHSETRTAGNVNGGLLLVERSLTADAYGLTIAGPMARFTNNCSTANGGTCFSSTSVLEIDQDLASSGGGLSVQSAGTGNGVFIDQDGNGIALNIDSEATTSDVINIDAENTAGVILDIGWSTATQTSSLYGARIDFSTVTADGASALYGLYINDHVGNTGSTERGIYVQGTEWDYGLYVEDLVSVGLGTTSSTTAVCSSLAGATAPTAGVAYELRDCDGAPAADYAEQYPVATGIGYGDIVVPGTKKVTTNDGQIISQLVKSTGPYQGPVAGIVSDNYGDFTSAGYNVPESENPMPVALVGRVPVNVTNENGAIKVGDYLTTSSTPGHAMKATEVGRVIGMALNDFNGTTGQVMVQVHNGWYMGDIIATDGSSTVLTDKIVVAPLNKATAATPGVDSYGFALRGSAWDGSQAQAVEMIVKASVTDQNNYRLSVRNTTDTEVAYITNTGTMQLAGDLVIAGKIYPSDRGTQQTSKYIYYDGSEGAGGDFMRTNAKGWSTGSYDFAEMFPSEENLQSGEVVVFAGDGEKVKRSMEVSSAKIAGIVSTRPGFLAGENAPGAHPIALAGRVPTRVTTENGEVKVGDPLTTSSKPGYAMKATKPGMIVGYALEPLVSGDKSILAYVNVGYWGGEATSSSPGTNNQASGFASGNNVNYTALNMSGNIYVSGHEIMSVGRIAGLSDIWSIEQDGTIKTESTLKVVTRSYTDEKVETIAVTSPESVVTLTGTAKLSGGQAEVRFEEFAPSFNDVTAADAPLRVIVTPSGPVSLYVSEKDNNHFVVKQFAGEEADWEFDWMVTAYRKGYEPKPIPPIILSEPQASEGSQADISAPEALEDNNDTQDAIDESAPPESPDSNSVDSPADDEGGAQEAEQPSEPFIETEESADEAAPESAPSSVQEAVTE